MSEKVIMKVLLSILLLSFSLLCKSQETKPELTHSESGWTRPLENVDMSNGLCWRITLTEIFYVHDASTREKRKFGGNKYLEIVEKESGMYNIAILDSLKQDFKVRLDSQIDGSHEFVIYTENENCRRTQYVFDSRTNFDFGRIEKYFEEKENRYTYSKSSYSKSIDWVVTNRKN